MHHIMFDFNECSNLYVHHCTLCYGLLLVSNIPLFPVLRACLGVGISSDSYERIGDHQYDQRQSGGVAMEVGINPSSGQCNFRQYISQHGHQLMSYARGLLPIRFGSTNRVHMSMVSARIPEIIQQLICVSSSTSISLAPPVDHTTPTYPKGRLTMAFTRYEDAVANDGILPSHMITTLDNFENLPFYKESDGFAQMMKPLGKNTFLHSIQLTPIMVVLLLFVMSD
jgi:hypothetical protein